MHAKWHICNFYQCDSFFSQSKTIKMYEECVSQFVQGLSFLCMASLHHMGGLTDGWEISTRKEQQRGGSNLFQLLFSVPPVLTGRSFFYPTGMEPNHVFF